MKPTVTIETITPAIAAKYLEKNINNRKINQKRVEALVIEFKEKKMILSPDAIAFEEQDSRLYNGQHRLTACIESGVPFQAIVLRNSPREAFMVTDIGARKYGAHALHTMGHSNSTAIASLARIIAGCVRTGGMADVFTSPRAVPPHEIVQVVEAYPKLEEYAVAGRNLTATHDRLCTTGTVIAVCLWHAAEAGCHDEMKAFLERSASGAGLLEQSPELTLRRRLANWLHKNKGSIGGSSAYREHAALIIKAFRMHVAGEKVTNLIWKVDEAFPTL